MNRLGLKTALGALAAAVFLTGCPREETLMSQLRREAAACVDPSGGGPSPCPGIGWQYDWVCGNITIEYTKNSDSADNKNDGKIQWWLPQTNRFISGPNAPDPTPFCQTDSRGDYCCRRTVEFNGLNRNTGSGMGGAADLIVKWRKETCASPGYREGKQGVVKRCRQERVDQYLELGGNPVSANVIWEDGDDVEDPE